MVAMLALIVFPLLMAFAASSDLLTMKISNNIVILTVGSFFILAFASAMPLTDIGWHVVGGVIVLIVAFSFFAFGWIGGGDAKLVAATTLWVGFGPQLVPYLIYAALLGGALTLFVLAIRRYPLPGLLAKFRWIDRLHDSKSGVPYGIALAMAGLLVYSDTTIFQHFIV